jgi:hypothetical protein
VAQADAAPADFREIGVGHVAMERLFGILDAQEKAAGFFDDGDF